MTIWPDKLCNKIYDEADAVQCIHFSKLLCITAIYYDSLTVTQRLFILKNTRMPLLKSFNCHLPHIYLGLDLCMHVNKGSVSPSHDSVPLSKGHIHTQEENI